jgi:hypothetical protein
MQQLGVQPSGPGDRLALKPLDDVQSLPKAGWISGTHLGPFGIAPVELGVDERSDVDTIDRHVLDLAIDVDPDQLDASHLETLQVDTAEGGPAQVDGAKLGAAEVNALES